MRNDREIQKIGASISGYIFSSGSIFSQHMHHIIHGNGRENPDDRNDRNRDRDIENASL